MTAHTGQPSRASSGPVAAALRHPLPWLFLLALAVRLWQLTYHSLWFDEVMSTFWAGKPAAEIWRVGLTLTQDKHPPLYYLLLHGWTALFGPGDVVVRSLGALMGALAVFPAYGVGRRLGGRGAAIAGTLLLALNPFLVWYSQEARMFMPATTFILAGLYGVLWLGSVQVRPGSYRRSRLLAALLVVVGFSAALYTYLFSAFALPVAAAWLLFLWWQGRGSAGNNGRLAWGVAALALVALLFLPLARSAWLVSGDESLPGRAFAGMNSALRDLLPVYTLGWPAWLARYGTWVLIGSGVLALAGLVLPDRLLAGGGQGIGRASAQAAPRWGGLYLATWLALPLLLGGLLLARDRTVFAETRYFIFLVPALCLAWGRALAAAWSWRRPVGALALVLVLAVTLSGLRADWTPPQRREAWREAAAYVQAHAGPRDAILIYPDYVRVAFERYFDGPQPVFAPFTDAIGDRSSIDGPLEGLAGYDAVWLVESHQQDLDPGNLIPGWFAARYPLITEQYPAGVALRGYATRYRSRQGPEPTLDVRLGDLRLLACQADPGPIRAQDDLYHPPSGWVHVTTYWTADEPIQADLFPTVQMIDELGQVWGDRLERSNDAIHLWPTSRWLPGEMVRVDYDVNLNPVTPPGRYRIVVGLPGVDGPFQCGTVEVE